MRYHRHAASLGLTLTLALQMNIIRGQHEPVLVGETENGTRYYVEAWPPGMRRNTDGIRRHTVNGIECMFMRPYLSRNGVKVKARFYEEWQWWTYKVDDVEGSKQYMTKERMAFRGGPSATGEPVSRWKSHSGSGFAWSPLLRPMDLSPVKDLIERERVYVTENADKPAPNGIYYGFNQFFRATVHFDKTSQVKQVRVNSRSCNRFNYTMLGKVVVGFFSDPPIQIGLILEPLDPAKYNGWYKSFSRARINTIEGWKGGPEEVYGALGFPNSKPSRAYSRLKTLGVSRIVRNAASRFRRRGRDGLKDELLTEDNTEGGHSR